MRAISQDSGTPASRGVVIVLLIWLTALFAGTICGSASAAEARGTNVAGGRYLIIVETSSSMKRRAANTQKVIGNLLASGLNGQLRPGDTIGIWTFSEDLNAGSVPLQRWSPQTRQRLAGAVVEFLQGQPYEKPAQIQKALTPMLRVVKDSDRITVLLISDGDGKVSGTPFDREINEAYKLNNAEQRKVRMPFVTVLRARKGQFIGWNVSMPPWPVEFPRFPVEPKIVEPISQEKPKAQEPKPEPPPPTVPSIIVTGKKPLHPPPPTNTTPAVTAKPETTPQPNPAATTAPATNPIVKTPGAEVPPPTSPVGPASATVSPGTQPVAVVPSVPPKSETAPLSRTEPSVSDKPTGQPVPVVSTNVSATAPRVTPTPTEPAPATSAPVAEAASEPTPPSPAVVQTGVATPSETVFNRTGVLIAAAVLLLVALGLVYALMRRSRTPAQVSLITRSMDRDKK